VKLKALHKSIFLSIIFYSKLLKFLLLRRSLKQHFILFKKLTLMKIFRRSFFAALFLTLAACSTTKKTTVYGEADGKVEWIFLQLNDVYEIAPLENGKTGGLARVATVKQGLLKENPNVFTVMAGDFLSPSVIGTLKYEGAGIKGRQMVETMNALGVNLVCFGNHEFDLDFADLQKRMDESTFEWLSSNAFKTEGEGIVAFGKTGDADGHPEYKVLTINDGKANESVKVGIWGVVLDANKKDYVQYSDPLERSKTLVTEVLPKEADVFVGLTHVAVDMDKQIASENPSVSLIMGGHEHTNQIYKIGQTTLAKADANAKTVYVHRCSYNLKTKKTTVKSELVQIDDSIADEPNVAAVVKKWNDIAEKSFKAGGFDPNETVAELTEVLDGREASLRLQQNNLGSAIAKSMSAAAKKAVDCAFFNSGSVRIDDQITGKITQKDIIRVMPFGGKVVEFDILGVELKKVLYAGMLSKGRGGYLQWDKINYDDASKILTINGAILDEGRTYHCATNDFLLTGKENNLDFFTTKNPNVFNVDMPTDVADIRFDIRKSFIRYLKNRK
jgi:2',3'-cyclic-nucleotide 2'-phosphodiesterase (5'-nucleotidase family)